MNKAMCPCGSKNIFDECCRPFIDRTASAKTAEELMRSRYSAFCRGNVDYLIKTLHPQNRQPDDKDILLQNINRYHWLGLTVLGTHQGLSTDDIGYVEFVAYFQDKQSDLLGQLHERSTFVKKDTDWYYLQGQLKEPVKTGRNEPCWCGSGKKFKKCHGK